MGGAPWHYFDIRLLSHVARVDEDSVIDLCDAGVTAAVLATTDRPDRYTFAHALIEHTLYDSLSPARRSRAHNAIAETLEALLGDDPGDRTAELAYHWGTAVQPADTNKAIHYAQLAGDRALAQLAPDESVRWYTQALELHDRVPHAEDRPRAELLVGLGDAQRQSGIAAHRETLLEACRVADRIDAVDLLVRAVLANNRGFMSVIGETDHERIAAIDRALERIGDTPCAERAQLLALAAVERVYVVDLATRLRLAEEAVEVARASGEPGALAWAIQRPMVAITHPSTLAQRSAWADEACDVADLSGDPAIQFWVRNAALLTAIERADGSSIDGNLRRTEAIAATIPHATIRWGLTFHQAWITGLHGDLAEYERIAEAALTFGMENGELDAFRIYGAQLVNARFHQGRLHELVPLIEQALADTPSLQVYRAVLAHAHACGQQLAQARSLFEEDRAAGFPMPDDQAWLTGTLEWVCAAVLLEEPDATLRERLLPYHDQIATTTITFLPAVSHHLGLLDHVDGRYDDADRWFVEALELHERARSPILVAQTRAAWAALLADRNQSDDHDRARPMATAALEAATTGGYGYIEADARAVLDRLA